MKRLIIIMNTDMNSEMIMPVTPESFQVIHGINIETVNIHTLGDVAIAGYPTLDPFKVDLMFPAQNYPFANFTSLQNPYNYTDTFQKYIDNRANLRYVISGTPINIPCKLESIQFGEKDGTNDVYATLTFHPTKQLQAVKVQASMATVTLSRSASAGPVTAVQSYKIKSGDTLSALCVHYYQDGSSAIYNKLAAYNGIKNANIIRAGDTIKIPPKSQL